MKKVILVDGNNLLFRSYYATAYKGNILRNSKGFPTNALYGFINMLQKLVKEENPTYVMVAFDKGKTFRHEKYVGYKDGRKETPPDLKEQFPVAKEITKAMGMKVFEIDNYEADDIIGTFAKAVDENDDFVATIISSDKDLLQLISSDVCVKLLKANDYIMMDEQTFIDTYGLTPDKMVDLKALMGDSSDNIPGVKGIGEKTALMLLQKYGSLNGIYENIESVTGKTKERLITYKENAYFSYELATIYKEVPIDTNLENIKYVGINDNYVALLKEYEFFSLLNKLDVTQKQEEKKQEELNIIKVEDIDEVKIEDDFACFIETNGNYHNKDIIGLSIYNKDKCYFIKKEALHNTNIFNMGNKKYTYDLKKLIVILKYFNIEYDNNFDDLMISAYLLNYSIKDDITYFMNLSGEEAQTLENLEKKKAKEEDYIENTVRKARFIYNTKDKFISELEKDECLKLYEEIELPLTYVLADMEYTGVKVSSTILNEMKDELKVKIDILTNEIYNLAGEEFNILSPKQLGTILFDKLKIPYPKRLKDNMNYSTSSDILNKLTSYSIISNVLEYRMLAKLYSNYAVGLLDVIKSDGRVHTIFNQTLTRTGRLSSNNPNLQNIPVREELGRKIRKAFLPSPNSVILSSDYSQIELRIFASLSEAPNLVEAFKNDLDIHTKTASDIFHVALSDVTKEMRRQAKAVNFGILYGISSFGLSEDLGIDVKDAKGFINHYLETYPGIKTYMDELIQNAKDNGYVKTLFGRKRLLEELSSTNFLVRQQGERMALNTPIQGTSADILKKAMIEIYKKFNELGLKSKMIIQVHDELIFDCLESEVETVKKIVKDIMENIYTLNVPLKVDINIGSNWYEAK